MSYRTIVCDQGKYTFNNPVSTFADMVSDLPEEADFAVRDVPNCADAKFTIGANGNLLCWVDKEGDSADWFVYNFNDKTWTKKV